MESGLRTPLLEFFRRGEVARDVRLLAAQGGLAPRAHEQLALLILLVADADPEIASCAEATLAAIPRPSLESFLARTDVPAEMREFFAGRGIEAAGTAAVDADAPIVDLAPDPEPVPATPEASTQPPAEGDTAGDAPADGAAASDAAAADGAAAAAVTADGAAADPQAAAEEKTSITQKIAKMTVAQRMSLAMKGSREERGLLVRDPNKLVSTSVLSSPKITESEIESIAKMANVSEEILRIIGGNRGWVKNYNVMLALVRNPKSPVGLAMNLLNRLNDKDLRQLSTNRNVADILRVTARKKVVIEK